ncbi:MAG: tRNA guanosine(34) transglycosylase Tgt [Acidobacteriota bacterium]
MSPPLGFRIVATSGRARRGVVRTAHGTFETPAFMPVGTAGTVKGMDPSWLAACGAEVVLANTYHLSLRPGEEAVRGQGGLHRFMAWPRPILTDSGGYQVMSLASRRSIDDDGVRFQSHLDGAAVTLTPERVAAIQAALGSDIAMPLDVCPHFTDGEAAAESAVTRSSAWARRALAAPRAPGQALFGIIQGGAFAAPRRRSLSEMLAMPFDGFAIGSVQVGEAKERSYETVGWVAAALPESLPRYVMGVGTPLDLVTMAGLGVDMFDTVLPTRNARNGMAFTSAGKLVIKNARYKDDDGPLDPGCGCPTCRRFGRAYLRHLYLASEVLAPVCLTCHNVWFYLDLMRQIRQAISSHSLDRLRDRAARFTGGDGVPLDGAQDGHEGSGNDA